MGIDMFKEERIQMNNQIIKLTEDIKFHYKIRKSQTQEIAELMESKQLLSLEIRLLKDETWGQGIDMKLNSNTLEMALREMKSANKNAKANESSTW